MHLNPFVQVSELLRKHSSTSIHFHFVPISYTEVKLVYDGNAVTNKELRIEELQEVEVRCLVEPLKYLEHARPIWKVTNGDSFPFGVHTDAMGVLTIRRLSEESALNYTCTVGELQASVDIIAERNLRK